MCPFKLNESYCAVLPCDILCFWTAVSKHFIKCWDFFSLSQSIQFELGWALLGVLSQLPFVAVATCGHLCACSNGDARVHLRRCNSNKKGDSFPFEAFKFQVSSLFYLPATMYIEVSNKSTVYRNQYEKVIFASLLDGTCTVARELRIHDSVLRLRAYACS